MISLMAKEQAFHRPAVIQAHRHLLLNMNDITFKGTGNLVAPDETHVRKSSISPGIGIRPRLFSFIAGWASRVRRLQH
jgi:hypothetical protein